MATGFGKYFSTDSHGTINLSYTINTLDGCNVDQGIGVFEPQP